MATAANASSPTGVSNMNAATRERKRAKDREAQRVSRERTKAYITHLETVVAELRQSSQKELGSTVEDQFKQQRKEIERLQRTVHKIARLAQSVANPQLAAELGSLNKEKIAESDSRMEIDGMRMTPEKEPTQTTPQPNQMVSAMASTNKPETPPSPVPSSPEDDAWQTKVMHGISPTDPTATTFLSSFLPRDLAPPNMFAALNGVITALQFCHGTKPQLTEAQDDDICIRAVFFGWNSVAETELDVVWRAVKTIDRRLYGRCRVIERAGMLRILRAMLVKIVHTGAKSRSTIPPYMNPTQLQNTKSHAPIVDLLIWPSLRDLMLAIDCTYSSQDSCLQYIEVLRFDWPYDARDMYKISYISSPPLSVTTTSTTANLSSEPRKMYSFTHEYEERYNDLRTWALKPGSKCLFQRPRLNLNYCDFSENDKGRVSECCFLCDTEVTTLGAGAKRTGGHEHHPNATGATGEGVLKGLAGGANIVSGGGVERVESRYEAALGAVYPNILLDM